MKKVTHPVRYLFFLLLCLTLTLSFDQKDVAEYLTLLPAILSASYSEPLPSDLVAACVDKGVKTFSEHSLTGVHRSSELSVVCGPTVTCIVEEGATLTMDTSLDVGQLIVRGSFVWDDDSQENELIWLCAGLFLAEGNGVIRIELQKNGILYVKDNGAEHELMGVRVIGGMKTAGSNEGFPKIDLIGSEMERTWSLISEKVKTNQNTISLMHDAENMGWKVGDRIVIAPCVHHYVGSNSYAEDFRIIAISDNIITLDSNTTQLYECEHLYTYTTGTSTSRCAEVINLSRNLIITGDDFSNGDCESVVDKSPTTCTYGLHAMQAFGGVFRARYTRIEKCGQRGVLGRYCYHFHLLGECPECILEGNAIEFGHHRGTTVHGTHLSTVRDNVYNDIRGSNIYIEDGNEMYNNIHYNVAVCPWPKDDETMHGCTIPGTDQGQGDTDLNQAGIWSVSYANNVVGNRMINHYNGMFYETSQNGRGEARDLTCPSASVVGRLQGNTFHNHGRFGTYFLNGNFPLHTDQTVDQNGFIIDRNTCSGFTADGGDNGFPMILKDNVDYSNSFNGGYDMGDLQLSGHISLDNLNNIYWKTAKNIADGCSAYVKNGYYGHGNLGLPDQGAFILENTFFVEDYTLESTHHCNEGVTGILCQPTYIFDNVVDLGTRNNPIEFHKNANNYGGIYTIAPGDDNSDGNIIPAGFVALVSYPNTHLLALDGGSSCFYTDDDSLGLDYEVRYDQDDISHAIICSRPLRSFKMYTSETMAIPLVVETWQAGVKVDTYEREFHQIANTRKQGYAFPIAIGLDVTYKMYLSGGGNIPSNWIIEFSETIYGNRWERDEVKLEIQGRTCPDVVHSQHDRKWIYANDRDHLEDNSWGHGACTEYPDEPTIDCNKVSLDLLECDICSNECQNGYCDCGFQECICDPGFTGENCEIDVCAPAKCGSHGRCSALYLGGSLPTVTHSCICEPGYGGDDCTYRVEMNSTDRGCYEDGAGNRLLNGYSFASDMMTISLCIETCYAKGFNIAGLEWSRECFCGNVEDLSTDAEADDGCTMVCSGDADSICGGTGRLSVYEIVEVLIPTYETPGTDGEINNPESEINNPGSDIDNPDSESINESDEIPNSGVTFSFILTSVLFNFI